MTNHHSPDEQTELSSLRSIAGWPALHPSMRETCKTAISELERLRAVAVAAKALVRLGRGPINRYTETVDEAALTALESALATAGYDMTDEEFAAALDREPHEPDGECFRGAEAAAYDAEEQARIQRELK